MVCNRVVHFARRANVGAFAQLFHHREHRFGRLIEQLDLFAETAAMQILRTNQNALADFLDRLGYFIKRGRQRLNVFAFERRDKCFAKLLGQLLRDAFVLAPALGELGQVLRRVAVLEFAQQIDEVMNAAVGLLRAGFEQIEKFFVVSEKFPDRKHNRPPIKFASFMAASCKSARAAVTTLSRATHIAPH